MLGARLRAELALRMARARGANVSWGPGPRFYEGFPVLRLRGELRVGRGFRMYHGPVRPRIIAARDGRVEIGDDVGLNWGLELHAARLVSIGDHTMVGTMVTIYDFSFHPVDEGGETAVRPVSIGANVWIGRQVTILPGVEIGDHSVVAAGAVVTRNVPPRTLVAGNPARVIREVRASDGWLRDSAPIIPSPA